MKRLITRSAVLLSIGSAVSIVLFLIFDVEFLLSLSITFCTADYHVLMRLIVGNIYNTVLHDHVDYRRWWFREHPWEKKLYKALRVKKWKSRIPAYDPDTFNPRIHSWDEIAQATCQAELVHETIMILSLLPIFCTKWFGAFPVFLITSIIAMLIDSIFVILQRYNRPRILKLVRF